MNGLERDISEWEGGIIGRQRKKVNPLHKKKECGEWIRERKSVNGEEKVRERKSVNGEEKVRERKLMKEYSLNG